MTPRKGRGSRGGNRRPSGQRTYSGVDTSRASGGRQAQRSATNWFLDAATYAHDGDAANARRAARRALRLIARRR